ncbi:MAG: hypothetical protein K0R39_3761 [Symbiobacteriaceae bacterium]|nr:hypothetical protein [Symbiobacteriaceae bacterium]
MRKSFWLPLALAALLIILIAGAQLGLRRQDVLPVAADLLRQVTRVAWLLMGAAAIGVWLYTRQRAAGFYAFALTAQAIGLLAYLANLHLVRFLLMPLLPIALTLAALAWAPAVPRRIRQALIIVTTITVLAQYLYLLVLSTRATQQHAAILLLIQSAQAIALTAAAWSGFRHDSAQRPLLWLAVQGLTQSISLLPSALSLLLWPTTPSLLLPAYFDYALTILNFVAAIGVLWSAAKPIPQA